MPIIDRVWDGDDADERTPDRDEGDGDEPDDLLDPEDEALMDRVVDVGHEAEEEPRTVFVVLDGDAPAEADLSGIEYAHLVVAADGAAGRLVANGWPPDVVVGDMDAVDPEVLTALEADGREVVRHPSRKDETDGQLALQRALEDEPERLVIIGGHGGRSAMFLANLGLLREASAAVPEALMRGHGETLRFVSADQPYDAALPSGTPFSLMAWGGPAELSLEGAEYELDLVRLAPDVGHGVSNRTRGGRLRIFVPDGLVLLVLENPDLV